MLEGATDDSWSRWIHWAAASLLAAMELHRVFVERSRRDKTPACWPCYLFLSVVLLIGFLPDGVAGPVLIVGLCFAWRVWRYSED